jgi:transcriptional regulator with XRE-family HTH domain
MSQEACGEAIGVSEKRISTYEQGQMAIPIAELQALATILNVPVEFFLDAEHNPIAKIMSRSEAKDDLGHLSDELRSFFSDPLNADYLLTAQRLSKLPTDQLRGMAETLLEITY